MTKSEIKVRIKEINSELDRLLQEDRLIKSKQYDAWITDLLLDMNENGVSKWPWAKLIDCVHRKALVREKDLLTQKPLPEGTIGVNEIARAKAVPMDQLLEFKRGVALCLWHNEKNPSMRWFRKNNKVKCFACGQVGDTVDITMKLYNLNLPQAVKRILSI